MMRKHGFLIAALRQRRRSDIEVYPTGRDGGLCRARRADGAKVMTYAFTKDGQILHLHYVAKGAKEGIREYPVRDEEYPRHLPRVVG